MQRELEALEYYKHAQFITTACKQDDPVKTDLIISLDTYNF